MPSPFPGMDPYLESPESFHGFREMLLVVLTGQLNADLPPDYAAVLEERVIVKPQGRNIYPDVFVIKHPQKDMSPQSGGNTAVLAADPPHQIAPLSEEMNESYIEIRTGKNWQEVVTIIELLSPANKEAGSTMRESYLRKQRELLCSKTHLLEIDLLRSGAYTLAAPLETLRRENNWHYLVSLSRHDRRDFFDYWDFSVRDRLPRILLPLANGDADFVLDLQTAFARVYEQGPYRRLLDYRDEPPPPPFVGVDAIWVDTLLRKQGFRSDAD